LTLSDAGVWGTNASVGGISILRSTNFRPDGEVSFDDLAIKEIGEKDKLKKLLVPGDILVEKSGGGPKQPVGRVVFFRGPLQQHVFGNFIARLRVNPKLCEPRYLFWFLHVGHQRGSTENFQKQTTGIRNLEFKRYLAQKIPLPPLDEQRRIVGLLDRAAEIRRRADAARAKARAIIPALFLDTFGDPATNPKGWPVVGLGKHADVQGGVQVSTKRATLPVEMPYLRVANVMRGSLNLSEIKTIRVTAAEAQRTSLVRGDVLVVEGHGNPNEIGRAAVWDGSIAVCTHQNHLIRARPDPSSLTPEYLETFLNSDAGRRILIQNGKTTSGLNTISTRNVKDVAILLPPLALQTAFAENVQRLEALARHLDAAAAKAEAMAAALSAEIFE